MMTSNSHPKVNENEKIYMLFRTVDEKCSGLSTSPMCNVTAHTFSRKIMLDFLAQLKLHYYNTVRIIIATCR